MNTPKVNVILASYNGAKFITAQLDSVVGQTYENIDIYIRDDGSTDNTVEIIEEYIRNNKSRRNIYLIDNEGVNLRCPKSFYEILRKCEPADYYAFCDQDDIWYENKIEWAVDALSKENQNQVLLYYSACDYSHEDGTVFRKSSLMKEQLELSSVLYYTPGPGFVMVFNEKCRQDLVLNVTPGTELHDRWILRGATCLGKVIYDPRSSASHVRHEEAVTSGDAGVFNKINNYIHRELFGPDVVNEKKSLEYFYDVFEEQLTDQQKRTLALFYKRNSVGRWFRKVFYPKSFRANVAGEISIRFLMLIGRI